jgi:hypothetical protein
MINGRPSHHFLFGLINTLKLVEHKQKLRNKTRLLALEHNTTNQKPPVASINKTEILLKVALNTIKQTKDLCEFSTLCFHLLCEKNEGI